MLKTIHLFQNSFAFFHIAADSFGTLGSPLLIGTLPFCQPRSCMIHFWFLFASLSNRTSALRLRNLRHIAASLTTVKFFHLTPFWTRQVYYEWEDVCSQLNYASKHQIILHPHSHLSKLIIENEHLRLLHSGVQLTQFSLRQKYWIVNDKSYIRSIIHKCITCFRYRARGCLLYTSRCV